MPCDPCESHAERRSGEFLGHRCHRQCHQQRRHRRHVVQFQMDRPDHLQLSRRCKRLRELLQRRQRRADQHGLRLGADPDAGGDQLRDRTNPRLHHRQHPVRRDQRRRHHDRAVPVGQSDLLRLLPRQLRGRWRRLVRHALRLHAGAARQLLFHDRAARARPRPRPQAQPGDRRSGQRRGADRA